jgi:hypothetical protein
VRSRGVPEAGPTHHFVTDTLGIEEMKNRLSLLMRSFWCVWADCSGHASESSLIAATLFDNASFLRSSAGSRARGSKRSSLA